MKDRTAYEKRDDVRAQKWGISPFWSVCYLPYFSRNICSHNARTIPFSTNPPSVIIRLSNLHFQVQQNFQCADKYPRFWTGIYCVLLKVGRIIQAVIWRIGWMRQNDVVMDSHFDCGRIFGDFRGCYFYLPSNGLVSILTSENRKSDQRPKFEAQAFELFLE